ncbi:Transcription initiation factor TFIID subunit 11 [Oopsacas minuta]|uniref:Transcription initiation factor TFIID subunit 11 n=1 Tax=Oopsacas minuta TaxID=111878 RepID=A0AAV7JM38_9METZ|nr:Transcription initiation factor TFIID subunit 11 [Oopsacas minuta]
MATKQKETEIVIEGSAVETNRSSLQTSAVLTKQEARQRAFEKFFRVDEKTIKMQVLVSAFTRQQQDQYEVYRRATFPKGTIKKLMMNLCKCPVPQNAVIAMAGIAKVYVGQIVEEACMVKDMWNDVGPLQPKHLREAYRRLKSQQVISAKRAKMLFH